MLVIVAVALISTPAAAAPSMPEAFLDGYMASGIAGRTMLRASKMAHQAAVLLEALKAYPAGATIPADDVKVTEWWTNWQSNYLDSVVYGTHLTWSSKDIPIV